MAARVLLHLRPTFTPILARLALPAHRAMSIKVGDELPSVDLFEETPANSVNTRDLCAGRKVLLFAVPGAFTPGCSKTHLPGFINQAAAIKSKGIQEIACVAVNDPFVMAAWGERQSVGDKRNLGKVRMLADTNGEFTKALGLDQDLAVLGGLRSKRYSMVVEDGRVVQLNVEPDGKGLSCSLAENTVAKLHVQTSGRARQAARSPGIFCLACPMIVECGKINMVPGAAARKVLCGIIVAVCTKFLM
ncbi:Peroxiredoxin-5, mitochondrial [Chionoecetes opilio]|uniref:Peroxiredoxin-5 n=1 Tax=Chionoecetes opilio TaxID=41210 RepID=A0A8J4Y511_CHIOP|nr:Peroxiredoxin-5, mitochondrial [Chionoecetes opilio]